MADHPEFPQERPAIKYLVVQASKIEDAQACGVGYYKSLGKVLARLDKTDEILSQLKQTTMDLKKVTDSDVVAAAIGKKADEMNQANQNALFLISQTQGHILHDSLSKIQNETRIAVSEMNGVTNHTKFVQSELHKQMQETITRLDNHIKDVDARVMPPLWKIYAYTFIAVLVGVGIGKFLL